MSEYFGASLNIVLEVYFDTRHTSSELDSAIFIVTNNTLRSIRRAAWLKAVTRRVKSTVRRQAQSCVNER